MEIITTSPRMHGIIVLYDMHTKFFEKAIEGISDEDAAKRLDTKANHVAWLTGSLVHERYELARQLGADLEHGAYGLFKDHQGIQDGVRYPPLAAFKADWEKISPVLRDAFVKATEAQLDQNIPMPGGGMSFYELIAFMAYREANCIGQIALWRRLLGYNPINYM